MRIEGGDVLAATLRELPKRVGKRMLREGLEEAFGNPTRAAASREAPKDPGAPDIAAHIVVSTATSRGGEYEASIAVGPSREVRSDQPERRFDIQGKFVHEGTTDTPPNAFLLRAFMAEGVRNLGTMGQILWRELAGRGFHRPTIESPSAPSGPGSLV